MGQAQLLAYDDAWSPAHAGCILELGIGSGRNLPFYGDAVEEIIGIDP
jgi:hypothetical protein